MHGGIQVYQAFGSEVFLQASLLPLPQALPSSIQTTCGSSKRPPLPSPSLVHMFPFLGMTFLCPPPAIKFYDINSSNGMILMNYLGEGWIGIPCNSSYLIGHHLPIIWTVTISLKTGFTVF